MRARYVCATDAKAECVQPVVRDPTRRLSRVAGSSDGRQVAVVSQPLDAGDAPEGGRGGPPLGTEGAVVAGTGHAARA